MEALAEYFASIPSLHRSIILVGGLTFFFLIENAMPYFRLSYSKWKHSGINIFFTLTTMLVNFAMAFILFMASTAVVDYQFGLLQWVSMPIWAQLVVGLLLLDLIGAWLAHYVEHHVKWMWQFHVIHHTDQHLDATSASRHHPGESVIRFVFTTIAVLIVGAPIWLVFLYQSASVTLSQFNHSNVAIPEPVDLVLRQLFCTPRMHRIHHHYRQPYSDMNYGNIFSIWDRIFGTYVRVDNDKIIYGVDTYMENEDHGNLGRLLTIPFKEYRKSIEYDTEEKL